MKITINRTKGASRRRKCLMMRFLKDYGAFQAWKEDVIAAPLNDDRKNMSASQILDFLAVERLNPILNGMSWMDSANGERFWCNCHMKWLDYKSEHIRDF